MYSEIVSNNEFNFQYISMSNDIANDVHNF